MGLWPSQKRLDTVLCFNNRLKKEKGCSESRLPKKISNNFECQTDQLTEEESKIINQENISSDQNTNQEFS